MGLDQMVSGWAENWTAYAANNSKTLISNVTPVVKLWFRASYIYLYLMWASQYITLKSNWHFQLYAGQQLYATGILCRTQTTTNWWSVWYEWPQISETTQIVLGFSTYHALQCKIVETHECYDLEIQWNSLCERCKFRFQTIEWMC